MNPEVTAFLEALNEPWQAERRAGLNEEEAGGRSSLQCPRRQAPGWAERTRGRRLLPGAAERPRPFARSCHKDSSTLPCRMP